MWTVPEAQGETDPFFKGKIIRLVVGYSPGGGFDTFARLLARHLRRYVPGEPRIIVQNMPGAGSLVAANRVYEMQPGDGLTIVTLHFGMITQAVIKSATVKFDPLKYIWLGDPAIGGLPQVLWVRSELPIHSLEDLKARKEPLSVGATGIGTSAGVAGEFLRHVGLPIKVVYGYRGSAGTMAALERKETDGRVLTQSTMETIYRRFIDEGLVRPILYIGSDPRVKPIPGVATLKDLKLTPDQRKLADFLMGSWRLLRLYALPPGTPPERVSVLRQAFVKTLKSPKLLNDAERQGVVISPIYGEEVGRIVEELFQTPPGILEQYKKLIGSK
jgi:tripartite-type tricarboxylate transporter receptor subunit TctC